MVHREKVERVRVLLGFEGLFAVDSVGLRGGIALLWKDKHLATLINYSQHHIDISVSLPNLLPWRLTGFYGHPNRNQRSFTWNLLRSFRVKSPLPWCCIGDFNDLLKASEKRGIRAHPSWLIDGFRQAVAESGLSDIGMEGYPYTWERRRGCSDWVEECLDRALASDAWRDVFHYVKLKNLEASASDHSPILLDFGNLAHVVRAKRFRFENLWLRESGCKDVIVSSWEGGSEVPITQRLEYCGAVLMRWSKDLTRAFSDKLSICRDQMKVLRFKRDAASLRQLACVQSEYNLILAQQEDFWKQRAKQHWLKGGDCNSRYFHASASSRRKRNTITQLKDASGNWKGWDEGLGNLLVAYFQDLFTSKGSTGEEILSCIHNQLTRAQQETLIADFHVDDVKEAVFSMHPDKSPGPDGMNPAFYQQFWSVLGTDVSNACLQMLHSFSLPEGLNDTSIVLIPKKKHPEYVTDLRPIYLCNVLYKIVSKMLATRLRTILPTLISESQSAFVPGRFITDNIMIASEVLHFLKRKTHGKDGFAALKVDMSKAYDRLEWNFLKNVMLKMGFPLRWIDWVMMCISSVRYSIVHQGQVLGPIVPTRGLRQGCPLSPYLFILCAEGLTALLRCYETRGLIHGCKVARGAPTISHLFFADDSFLFFKANGQEGCYIKECLHLYEEASGQMINFQKSSISFSRNTNAAMRSDICNLLDVRMTDDHGHCLGLPSLVGRNKNQIFSFLKDKLWSRLQGWKGKFLSRAGKEVLIKTVAQALPTFALNVFLIPLDLCAKLERMMNSFWWGNGYGGSRGINWMSWERLCVTKINGGLGFRKLHEFNLGMLGKTGWRLLLHPESLVARLYRARYYPTTSFLDATLRNNPSYLWRSILASQPLIRSGVRWRVGNGARIKVWTDPWLPDDNNPRVASPVIQGTKDAVLRSLMRTDERTWDEDIIRDLFCERDRELIYRIPLSQRDIEDRFYWSHDQNGVYTVRSAYRTLTKNLGLYAPGYSSAVWQRIWALPIPPKVKNLVWRACSNCLPTKDELLRRHVDVDPHCPVCNAVPESALHLFVQCPTAIECWRYASVDLGFGMASSFIAWISDLFAHLDKDVVQLVCMLMWSLWSIRNDVVWNSKRCTAPQLLNLASSFLSQWKAAQAIPNGDHSPLSNEGVMRWQKPAAGWLKCNVDGALFHGQNKLGYGWVLRDSAGQVQAAASASFASILEASLAEAISIREALSWIKMESVSNVIIESDSLVLVQAIKSSTPGSSYLGLLIEDCKTLLHEIAGCRICFVRRSANTVAHLLARASGSVSGVHVWGSSPPSFICTALLQDSY